MTITANEIPTAKGKLPFIGHGMKVFNDPDAFFLGNRDKHGDLFKINMENTNVIMFCNEDDMLTIMKKNKIFCSQVFNRDKARGIFLVPNEVYDTTGVTLRDQTRDCLKKKELGDYNNRMQIELDNLTNSGALDHLLGENVDLGEFIGSLVFVSGSNSIFSKGLFEPEQYQDFKKFNASTVYFAAEMVPPWMMPRANNARNRIIEALRKIKIDENTPSLVTTRYALPQSFIDRENVVRFNFGAFWAGNANTINIVNWIISHASKDPVLMDALKEEAQRYQDGLLSQDDLDAMTVTHSASYECLRMYSGSMITRDALEDTTVPLKRGEILSIKKGERVSMYTRIPHTDTRYFPDPLKFDAFRFVEDPERLKHVYPWGGGVGICPGRFFAVNEFKLVVHHFFNNYEISVSDSETIPEVEKQSMLLGSGSPNRGMKATIKKL